MNTYEIYTCHQFLASNRYSLKVPSEDEPVINMAEEFLPQQNQNINP
jgi:hypothetical protein